VLLARGRERLETVAAEIGAESEVCDVGERQEVEGAAGRIGARHAAVHLLVNNAGIPGGGGFLDLPPERLEAILRTNYLGSVWCLRAFLPLLQVGAPADVVNVASVAGAFAFGSSGPYAAAKHAQLAFSRAVARELAPLGIRVHAVNPGPVVTEGFPQRRLLARRLGRRLVLQPNEIADAIVAAVERNRMEVFVPRYVRVAGVLQGLTPGTLTRMLARRRVT
jgi:uncharacterized protein